MPSSESLGLRACSSRPSASCESKTACARPAQRRARRRRAGVSPAGQRAARWAAHIVAGPDVGAAVDEGLHRLEVAVVEGDVQRRAAVLPQQHAPDGASVPPPQSQPLGVKGWKCSGRPPSLVSDRSSSMPARLAARISPRQESRAGPTPLSTAAPTDSAITARHTRSCKRAWGSG